MKNTKIEAIIREEVSALFNEAANPELDRTVDKFVKGLATKYGYKSSDAVMAIFEALKRLNLIHKDANYKAPSGFEVAESAYAMLGGEHPMQDAEMRKKVVEPNLGPNYEAVIMFKDSAYKQVAAKYPYAVTEKWKNLYRSSNYQGYAQISPDGKVIKAAILDQGGIVGAYYIKSGASVSESFKKSHLKGLIREAVNAKLRNEGAMSELDILMDESRNFADFLNKVKSDPKFKGVDVNSPEVKDFLQTMWDDTMDKGSTMGMAAEGLIRRLVREELKQLKKSK